VKWKLEIEMKLLGKMELELKLIFLYNGNNTGDNIVVFYTYTAKCAEL